MNKREWLRLQYESSVEKDTLLFAANLNAPILIDNPSPQGRIPKSINLTQIVDNISGEDILILYTQYSTIVSAIIENINRSAIADVGNLIRGLLASNLSQSAKDTISTKFQEVALSHSDPANYGDLDPNWEPQIIGNSIAKSSGFGVITASDIQDALRDNGAN